MCFTGVKGSVMVLQSRKSSPQKSRPLESGNRRHAVWIAIEYSYKLGQKNKFKFWCELGWFLQRQSHISIIQIAYLKVYANHMKGVHVKYIIHSNVYFKLKMHSTTGRAYTGKCWYKFGWNPFEEKLLGSCKLLQVHEKVCDENERE